MGIPSLSGSQLTRLKDLLRTAPAAPASYERNPSKSFLTRAVWVRVAAGSAGSSSSTCNFTYNIYQPGSGELLASALTPIRPRLTNVEYETPANDSYGVAFKDGSGWKLIEALKEFPKQEECE